MVKNTISGTAIDTKAAAARIPQSPPRVNPAGRRRSHRHHPAFVVASIRNTLATSRSFHVQRNWKIAKLASAGKLSGRMMR
jgi:hypothetical protein